MSKRNGEMTASSHIVDDDIPSPESVDFLLPVVSTASVVVHLYLLPSCAINKRRIQYIWPNVAVLVISFCRIQITRRFSFLLADETHTHTPVSLAGHVIGVSRVGDERAEQGKDVRVEMR